MATHKQAKKRAHQSERRRQRNMHVKSTVRTHVKRVRYAVDTIRTIDAGRQVHPQEVEKHLKGILERRANDYRAIEREVVLTKAQELLARGSETKKFDREKHRAFLEELARADLYIASRALSKAASRGVFHARNVSRRISRLSLMLNSVQR